MYYLASLFLSVGAAAPNSPVHPGKLVWFNVERADDEMLAGFAHVVDLSALPLAAGHGATGVVWVRDVEGSTAVEVEARRAVLVDITLLQLGELPVLGRDLLPSQSVVQVLLPHFHLFGHFCLWSS